MIEIKDELNGISIMRHDLIKQDFRHGQRKTEQTTRKSVQTTRHAVFRMYFKNVVNDKRNRQRFYCGVKNRKANTKKT